MDEKHLKIIKAGIVPAGGLETMHRARLENIVRAHAAGVRRMADRMELALEVMSRPDAAYTEVAEAVALALQIGAMNLGLGEIILEATQAERARMKGE